MEDVYQALDLVNMLCAVIENLLVGEEVLQVVSLPGYLVPQVITMSKCIHCYWFLWRIPMTNERQ